MNEGLRQIGKENNHAKAGIIVSAVIIFGGLLPNIETSSVKIFFPDSILILLIGFCSLFFFMHIKVNQNEKVDENNVVIITPVNKSLLSKTCLNISIFLFILTILRIIILIISEFVK